VLEAPSCARCLNVNCDFRRRVDCGENGEEAIYGCEEDMVEYGDGFEHVQLASKLLLSRLPACIS